MWKLHSFILSYCFGVMKDPKCNPGSELKPGTLELWDIIMNVRLTKYQQCSRATHHQNREECVYTLYTWQRAKCLKCLNDLITRNLVNRTELMELIRDYFLSDVKANRDQWSEETMMGLVFKCRQWLSPQVRRQRLMCMMLLIQMSTHFWL